MPSTTCPHCGAENPTSPLVTLCEACGEPLSNAAKPPPKLGRDLSSIPPPVAPVLPALRLPDAPPPPPRVAGSPTPPQPAPDAPPQPAAINPTGFALPIRTHVGLFVALPGVGGFAGFFLFALLMFTHRLDPLPLGRFPETVAFFGLTLGGVQLPRLILTYLIPARCPQCGGSARVRGGHPIAYQCRACGHVHRTSVDEGHFSAGVGG